MAAKDFGVYRENTGGTVITAGISKMTLDTTVRQDDAFSINGGRDEVTALETRNVLAMWGGKFEGSGALTTGLGLTIDSGSGFGTAPGGVSYASHTNNASVTYGRSFGAALLRLEAGHKLALFATTLLAGDVSGESSGSTWLQLLALPDAFPMVVYSQTAVKGVGSTHANQEWNTEHYRDSFFSTDGSPVTGLVPSAACRLLVVANLGYDLNAGVNVTEGLQWQQRVLVDSVNQSLRFGRKCQIHKQANAARMNVLNFGPIDADASDVINIQRRYQNKGDATDTSWALGGLSCSFGLLWVPSDTDWIRMRRTSDTANWTGTSKVIDWGANMEVDGSWAHSETVDNDEVTEPSSGKILMACKADIDRTGTNSDHASWDGWFQDDGTAIPYGQGCTDANLGDPPSHPKQNVSSAWMALLRVPDGSTLTVRFDEIGSAADSTSTLQGGTDVWDSDWWGIDLDSWPDDQVLSVSPLAASPGLPAVGLSAQLTVGPGALGAEAAAVAPTAALGTLVLAPAALGELAAAVAPGMAAVLTVAPAALGALPGLPAPLFVPGPISVSVAPLAALAVPVDPVAILRGVGFHEAVAIDCRQAWLSYLATTTLPTRFQNLRFTPGAGAYAEHEIEWSSVEVLDYGGDECRLIASGVVVVTLAVPSQRGMFDIKAELEAIRAWFTDQTYGRVHFTSPLEQNLGRRGGRRVQEIRLPFWATDTDSRAPVVVGPALGDGGFAEAAQIIRERFIAEVGDVESVPLQFPNMPFAAVGQESIAVSIVPGGAVQSMRGLPGALHTINGFWRAKVRVPLYSGEERPLALIDVIDQAFRCVQDRGVQFAALTPGRGMRVGGQWVRTATCPWSVTTS